jgi:hypothetical protein
MHVTPDRHRRDQYPLFSQMLDDLDRALTNIAGHTGELRRA